MIADGVIIRVGKRQVLIGIYIQFRGQIVQIAENWKTERDKKYSKSQEAHTIFVGH